MALEWQAAIASVRGREHARLGRNNQDAVAGCRLNGAVSVVVADGCSAGAFSEVGARLVARFVSERACFETEPAALVDALLTWLSGVSLGEAFVQEQLLTTFLCAVARGDEVTVFGVGDGVVWVDGACTRLDAGADNAPAYVAYRLLALEAPLAVHHRGRARRVAVATDGAARLQLEPWFGWKNPYALQRGLNVTQGLFDDCSVALLEAR